MHTTRTGKIISVLIIAALAALGLRAFVIEGFFVDGLSMYPTLQGGDYVLVSKLAYVNKEPQRGDIVVATPRQYTQKVVKRVLVLPYEMYDKGDGVKDNLDPGEYFLVGDNMAQSVDSRTFGPVDRWDIKGKVIFDIRLKTLQIIRF